MISVHKPTFLSAELFSKQFNIIAPSETTNLASEQVRDFTILEIQDSVLNASVKPAEVGNQLIDKRKLQINPGKQLWSTQPQPLDSGTFKKLRIGSKRIVEN